MTKTVLASTLTAVTLTAASAAFADPVRIIQNGSGVAGLSYALENGVEDFASDPDAVGGPNSVRLSTRVGSTSTDAAAALVSDFSDPSRLSGTGSTSVSYATEVGQGEGHVSSYATGPFARAPRVPVGRAPKDFSTLNGGSTYARSTLVAAT